MRSVCACAALMIGGASVALAPGVGAQPAVAEAVLADDYVPIAQVRDVAPGLRTLVTVSATRQLLEQVLEQIAEQADVGLSYGENLVRARVVVSLTARRSTAADALLAAVRGTAWDVLATQTGRVTVVPRSTGHASAASGGVLSSMRRAWRRPIR